ncbi:MAG: hypothetical protein RLZZ177_2739 [Pseudomonadota bacterium]
MNTLFQQWVEIEGTASMCFELTRGTHNVWTHTFAAHSD